MAGRFRHVAEVVRRRHEPAAEVMHPDSIHPDSRGERIRRRRDRLGQIERGRQHMAVLVEHAQGLAAEGFRLVTHFGEAAPLGHGQVDECLEVTLQHGQGGVNFRVVGVGEAERDEVLGHGNSCLSAWLWPAGMGGPRGTLGRCHGRGNPSLGRSL